MTNDEEGEALLRAVLDGPGDDGVRLVYADWLEERGEQPRAEFIRLQVALAGMKGPSGRTRPPADWLPRDGPPSLAEMVQGRPYWDAAARCAVLAEDGERGPLVEATRLFRPRRLAWYWWPDCSEAKLQDLDDTSKVLIAALRFRKGFIDVVTCGLGLWREHGPKVVRAHPVTRVECADAFAVRHSPGGLWGVAVRVPIPRPLQGPLRQVGLHDSEAACNDAISLALLRWAKATCPRCLGAGLLTTTGPPPEAGEYVVGCPDCTSYAPLTAAVLAAWAKARR